jgi:hypothetical protein
MMLDKPTLHSARDLRSLYLKSLIIHGWIFLNRLLHWFGAVLKRRSAEAAGDGSA